MAVSLHAALLSGYGAGIDDGHRLVIHLDKLHGHLGNLLHIAAYHVHVRGEKDKRFAVLALLDCIYLGYRLGICGIAADAPYGVGRVEDDAAVSEYVQYFVHIKEILL